TGIRRRTGGSSPPQGTGPPTSIPAAGAGGPSWSLRALRAERAERAERPQRTEGAERAERPQRAERAERPVVRPPRHHRAAHRPRQRIGRAAVPTAALGGSTVGQY